MANAESLDPAILIFAFCNFQFAIRDGLEKVVIPAQAGIQNRPR
jgi:hypothetical protein